MFRTKVLVGLMFIMLGAAWPAGAQGVPPPQVSWEEDLEKLSEGKKALQLEGGAGVSFNLIKLGEYHFGWKLTVSYRGVAVKVLEGGLFTSVARIESGPLLYWVIGEYTGGAHCCGVYHFLVREDPARPVRYLGKTAGHNAGPLPLGEAIVYRGGQIYFIDWDNRFDYFHASHAECRLVNLARTHYRLTPEGLKLANEPFRDIYLEEAARMDQDIKEEAAKRPTRPAAILVTGYSEKYDELKFSDALGQMLVARTLFYLYAREEGKARETFEQDVRRYYQTSRWAKELYQEVREALEPGTY